MDNETIKPIDVCCAKVIIWSSDQMGPWYGPINERLGLNRSWNDSYYLFTHFTHN